MSDITPITMPKFGLAMTEGKIVSWAKPEGSEIAVGDELADIETSKITNAYASPVKGVLRRHVAAEQEELPIGALIAVVCGRVRARERDRRVHREIPGGICRQPRQRP